MIKASLAVIDAISYLDFCLGKGYLQGRGVHPRLIYDRQRVLPLGLSGPISETRNTPEAKPRSIVNIWAGI